MYGATSTQAGILILGAIFIIIFSVMVFISRKKNNNGYHTILILFCAWCLIAITQTIISYKSLTIALDFLSLSLGFGAYLK
jgi:uncharacterized membrane protein